MLKRIDWIDWAKAIGIFLVVFAHVPFDREIRNIIYSFHMPLFFIISGFLHKDNSLVKNIKALIIPYLIYTSIALFFRLLFSENIWGDFKTGIIGILYGVGYNTQNSFMPNVPCWFFISLFWVKLFYQFSLKRLKVISMILILTFLIILLKYFKSRNIDLLLSLDSAIMALPFYYCGTLFKRYKIEFSLSKITLIFISAISAIMTVSLSILNGRVSINACYFGKSLIIAYLSGIVGFIMVYCFTITRGNNNIVKNISESTPIILGTHILFLPVIIKCLNTLIINFININNTIVTLLIAFVGSILVLLISYYPSLFLKSKFPILVGK
ncbi:acyltransferase family protein [Epilithonimonas sp.]|uniref:acyltransferase family protein n=1 Tax=Epilithonimonas sp. TaxID=2894511 RepID=UPI0028A9E80A|nr:acyltransferase family protein [Epilithonimonas sp.]